MMLSRRVLFSQLSGCCGNGMRRTQAISARQASIPVFLFMCATAPGKAVRRGLQPTFVGRQNRACLSVFYLLKQCLPIVLCRVVGGLRPQASRPSESMDCNSPSMRQRDGASHGSYAPALIAYEAKTSTAGAGRSFVHHTRNKGRES